MDVTAKIIKKLNPLTGEGKNGKWMKQEIIVETIEQYPRKICISFWGDKCNELNNYNINDVVKIFISIESREYNERWYTDVRGWKIEAVTKTTPTEQIPSTNYGSSSFDELTPNYSNISSGNSGEKYDDLPF